MKQFKIGEYKAAYDIVTTIRRQYSDMAKLSISEKKILLEARVYEIEMMVNGELFDNAEKNIDEVVSLAEEHGFEPIIIDCHLLRSSMILYQGDVKESQNEFLKAEKIFNRISDKLDKESRLFSKIHRYIGRFQKFKGRPEVAEKEYLKGLEIAIKKNDLLEISHVSNSLGIFYIEIGEIDKAFKYLNKANEIRTNLGNKYLMATSLNSLGLLCQNKGELEEASRYFHQALEISTELDLTERISNLYNNIGIIYQNQGILDKALEYYNLCLSICEESNNRTSQSMSFNNIGLIYLMQGDLNKALEYEWKSILFGKNFVDPQLIAGSYNNIGIIYGMKGELEKALENHHNHLEVAEKYKNQVDIATGYLNIGLIHQMKGEYDSAHAYFKKSLAMDKEIGNDIDIAESNYQLIILELERGNREQAQLYLDDLKAISDKSDNKLIDLRYRIANAVCNKNSDRFITQSQAQEALIKIANEEIIDHELTVFAKLNLCEVLLFELRITKNEDVLTEIKQLVDDLLKIAKDQHSSKLLVESYLIRSKLAILEVNIPLAFDLLNKAQDLAKQNGLTNLSLQISNQYDTLLDKQELYKRLDEGNVPLHERLSEIDVEKLVTSLIHKHQEPIPEEEENPAYLFIISHGGVTLFSKQFDEESPLKNELLGGLLTAIHTMSGDIFSTEGTSIQRIKHDEYTIINKPVNQLLFSYVFTGASYNALNKLENFINLLTSSELIWETLQRQLPQLTESEKNGLELIVKEIFPQ